MTAQAQYLTKSQPITVLDVERAWREQVVAVDRWQTLADRGRDQSRIEQAWDEMQEATVHAMALDRAYSEQYDRMYKGVANA